MWDKPYSRRILLLVVVMGIALALRVVWIVHIHPVPSSDFAWYRDKAIGILDGLGYVNEGHPTAYFPIGYPLFLAGVFAVFGVYWGSAVAANILLSVLTVGLVFLIAERLHGWLSGLIAGLFLACYVPNIEWSSVLCSEVLFTFLFLGTIYLWMRLPHRRPAWMHWLVSGIVLGLACIVRPILLLLPFGLLVYFLIAKVGWKQSVLRTLMVAVVMCITISPLTIRNYIQFHHVIPVSTNGGVNLWQGFNPNANGEYFWPSNPKTNPFLNYVNNEVVDDQKATHLAVNYILHHPLHTVQLGFTKWRYFFEGTDNAEFWSVQAAIPPISHSLVKDIAAVSWWEYILFLALSVLGLIFQIVHLVRTHNLRPVIVWISMAYYIGLFFIFPAWDRMRAPLDPLIIVLASVGIALALEKSIFRRSTSTTRTDFRDI